MTIRPYMILFGEIQKLNKNYITIVQASDFHICENGCFAYNVSDTVKGLKDFVRNINKHTFKIDIICITGDLSDDGSITSYEIVKENYSVEKFTKRYIDLIKSL